LSSGGAGFFFGVKTIETLPFGCCSSLNLYFFATSWIFAISQEF